MADDDISIYEELYPDHFRYVCIVPDRHDPGARRLA